MNTIVKVDTSTWTITTLTSTLNSPIYGMGAVNLNGCIYAMGGVAGTVTNKTYMLNPTNDTLYEIYNMRNATSRFGIAACNDSNIISIFGGMTSASGNLTNEVQIYRSSLSQ